MAKLVFGMNVSLDGYVDVMELPPPSAALFRQFIVDAEGQIGSIYGRQIYEMMRYWEVDHPDWDAERTAFGTAWRKQRKWVASRSAQSLGPNATQLDSDLGTAVSQIK